MKYRYTASGSTPRYIPQWTIVSGPDKYGCCKCVDEKINVTVFLNIKDLKPIEESKGRSTGQ